MNVRKIVSCLTVLCFLFSFVFAETLHAVVETVQAAHDFRGSSDGFIIPASVGRITAARYFGSDTVVINIQDLHCHPEVQRNIAQVLSLLDARYKLKKVYVEGAAGEVDAAWLSGLRDAGFRKELAETLVDQGKLTGAEYYSFLSGRANVLSGLEDEALYRENFDRLSRIIGEKGKYDRLIEELTGDLAEMKVAHFNSPNRRFENIVERYRKGGLAGNTFYRFLWKYADKLSAGSYDYGNIAYFDRARYRNIDLYLRMNEVRKRFNAAGVKRELTAFIASLKNRLPYSAYGPLVEKTDNFRKLDELVQYLPALAREYRIEPDAAFPNLKRFFDYLEMNRNINPLQMPGEERRLVQGIRAGLSEDVAEYEVSFLSDFFGYFEAYLTNKLSAEDYGYFQERFGDFHRLWAKYAPVDRFARMEEDFRLLDDFNRVNLERNRSFLRNILAGREIAPARYEAEAVSTDPVGQTVRSLDGARDVIVIVAGGFHTDGLERLLETRKISYLAITPNVTKETKESDRAYLELAKEQSRILSQSFALYLLAKFSPSARIVAVLESELAKKLPGIDGKTTFLGFARRSLGAIFGKGADLEAIKRACQDICAAFNRNFSGSRIEYLAGQSGDDGSILITFAVSLKDEGRTKELNFRCLPGEGTVGLAVTVDEAEKDADTDATARPGEEKVLTAGYTYHAVGKLLGLPTGWENEKNELGRHIYRWQRWVAQLGLAPLLELPHMVLNPVGFYRSHDRSRARIAGIALILAVTYVAGFLTGSIFIAAAANVISHGLWNAVMRKAPLVLAGNDAGRGEYYTHDRPDLAGTIGEKLQYLGKAEINGEENKEFWVDTKGRLWIFKINQDTERPYGPLGAETYYTFARKYFGHRGEAYAVTLRGKKGTLEKALIERAFSSRGDESKIGWANAGDINGLFKMYMLRNMKNEEDLGSFSLSFLTMWQIEQILQEMVIDWLFSNHGGNSANYLIDLGEDIIGVDKEQVFKHFPHDKLSLQFTPNGMLLTPPHYFVLLDLALRGGLSVNLIGKTLLTIQKIPDAEFIAMIRPFAVAYAAEHPDMTEEAFIEAVRARKAGLGREFSAFFAALYPRRQLVAGTGIPVEYLTRNRKRLEAVGRLTQEEILRFNAVIRRFENRRGDVDTKPVLDVLLRAPKSIAILEKLPDRVIRGFPSSKLLLSLQLKPEELAKLMQRYFRLCIIGKLSFLNAEQLKAITRLTEKEMLGLIEIQRQFRQKTAAGNAVIDIILTLLGNDELQGLRDDIIRIGIEELGRWEDGDIEDLKDIGKIHELFVQAGMKEPAMRLLIDILRKRDVELLSPLSVFAPKKKSEVFRDQEHDALREFLNGGASYRKKKELMILASDWENVRQLARPELSRDMSDAIRAGKSGRVGEIARQAKTELLEQMTGQKIPDAIAYDERYFNKIDILFSLAFSVSGFKDTRKMKGLIKDGLARLMTSRGSVSEVRDWIMAMPENRKERERLVGNGYDKRLWEEGITVKGIAVSNMSPEEQKEQRMRQAHQLIEIAKILGVVDPREMETRSLSTYEEAREFVEKEIIARWDEALEQVSEEELEHYETNLHDILRELKRLETVQKERSREEEITITIAKDFVAEGNAGVGVPGCFNPYTGVHREMPVMHALESNAFFAQAYDSQGRQIANVVLLLTDQGVIVYGDYNRSSLNLDPLWTEAWKGLSRYVPAVILDRTSAGIESSRPLGRKGPVTTAKRATIWTDPYVDFGAVQENGDVSFDLKDAEILTETFIEANNGFESSREMQKFWQAKRDAAAVRQEKVRDGAAKAMDQLGRAFARNPGLKPYLFLVGKIKSQGLAEVTQEDMREWFGERNKDSIPEDAVLEQIWGAVESARARLADGALTLPENREKADALRAKVGERIPNRFAVELIVGMYVGVIEFFRTLNPFAFYEAHYPGVPKEARQRTAERKIGIVLIWAAMIGSMAWAATLGAPVVFVIAAGVAGNVVSHGLFNETFEEALFVPTHGEEREDPGRLGKNARQLVAGTKISGEDLARDKERLAAVDRLTPKKVRKYNGILRRFEKRPKIKYIDTMFVLNVLLSAPEKFDLLTSIPDEIVTIVPPERMYFLLNLESGSLAMLLARFARAFGGFDTLPACNEAILTGLMNYDESRFDHMIRNRERLTAGTRARVTELDKLDIIGRLTDKELVRFNTFLRYLESRERALMGLRKVNSLWVRDVFLRIIGDEKYRGLRNDLAQIKIEELERWGKGDFHDIESVRDIYDLFSRAGMKAPAVRLLIDIIRKRDIELVHALSVFAGKGQSDNFMNEEHEAFRSFLESNASYRKKKEVAFLVSEWEQMQGRGDAALSREISDAVRSGNSERLRSILWQERQEFLEKRIGLQVPADVLADDTLFGRIATISSLYNSIAFLPYFANTKQMRGLTKEALARLVISHGSAGEVRDWILAMPENQKEMQTLIRRGYDRRLWENGIMVKGIAKTDVDPKAREVQRTRHARQIIEIAKILGLVNRKEPDIRRLSTIEEARQFVENRILARKDEALKHVSKEEFEQYEADLKEILKEFEGIETGQKEDFREEEVTITVKKDFAAEASAGAGVPACYNPKTGIHREMPVMHALEANAIFAQAYDSRGHQIANVVLLLTDKGVIVCGEYNGSSLDLDPLWAEAWKELSKYVPAVILWNAAAGIKSASRLGRKGSVTATKRATIWTDPYVDFGSVKDDGTINFRLRGAIIVTKASIKSRGGFEASPEVQGRWQAKREVSVVQQKKVKSSAAKAMDVLGKTFAGDAELNHHLFLVGKIKAQGLAEVTQEDIRDWFAEQNKDSIPETPVLKKIWDAIQSARTHLSDNPATLTTPRTYRLVGQLLGLPLVWQDEKGNDGQYVHPLLRRFTQICVAPIVELPLLLRLTYVSIFDRTKYEMALEQWIDDHGEQTPDQRTLRKRGTGILIGATKIGLVAGAVSGALAAYTLLGAGFAPVIIATVLSSAIAGAISAVLGHSAWNTAVQEAPLVLDDGDNDVAKGPNAPAMFNQQEEMNRPLAGRYGVDPGFVETVIAYQEDHADLDAVAHTALSGSAPGTAAQITRDAVKPFILVKIVQNLWKRFTPPEGAILSRTKGAVYFITENIETVRAQAVAVRQRGGRVVIIASAGEERMSGNTTIDGIEAVFIDAQTPEILGRKGQETIRAAADDDKSMIPLAVVMGAGTCGTGIANGNDNAAYIIEGKRADMTWIPGSRAVRVVEGMPGISPDTITGIVEEAVRVKTGESVIKGRNMTIGMGWRTVSHNVPQVKNLMQAILVSGLRLTGIDDAMPVRDVENVLRELTQDNPGLEIYRDYVVGADRALDGSLRETILSLLAREYGAYSFKGIEIDLGASKASAAEIVTWLTSITEDGRSGDKKISVSLPETLAAEEQETVVASVNGIIVTEKPGTGAGGANRCMKVKVENGFDLLRILELAHSFYGHFELTFSDDAAINSGMLNGAANIFKALMQETPEMAFEVGMILPVSAETKQGLYAGIRKVLNMPGSLFENSKTLAPEGTALGDKIWEYAQEPENLAKLLEGVGCGILGDEFLAGRSGFEREGDHISYAKALWSLDDGRVATGGNEDLRHYIDRLVQESRTATGPDAVERFIASKGVQREGMGAALRELSRELDTVSDAGRVVLFAQACNLFGEFKYDETYAMIRHARKRLDELQKGDQSPAARAREFILLDLLANERMKFERLPQQKSVVDVGGTLAILGAA